MIRSLVPSAAAAVILLGLAGCASSTPEPSPSPTPTPTPTATGAARCSPENSTVTFGEQSLAERRPVGYRTITTDAVNTRVTSETQFEYESTANFTMGGDPRTNNPQWVDFLLDELNASGETDQRVGDPVIDFGQNSVQPSVPGDFVVLYDLEQRAFPFTIECGGGPGEGEGTLVTSAGGLGVTAADCTLPLDPANPLAATQTQACAS